MTYLLTFCVGFVLGYLFESFRDMLSDEHEDEDDYYISITEKGRQRFKDHSDDNLDNSKEET